MQKLLFLLGLMSYLTTAMCATSSALQTENSSLISLESDILAGGSSKNDSLHLNPDNFPAFNASTFLIEVTCSPSTDPTRYPRVVVDDYYEAVDQILTREDAMLPRQLVLGPHVCQTLVWESGRCRIGLGATTLMRTRAFPIILAAHMAALIAKECVTEAKGYVGGTARLNSPESPLLVLGAIRPMTEEVDAALA